MSQVEQTLELRGMPRFLIEEYFISIGGHLIGPGKFLGSDWEVIIGDEYSIDFGSIRIPARQVTFRTEKELCRSMVNAFRLNFLSAGG
jgi:hypothetical protein